MPGQNIRNERTYPVASTTGLGQWLFAGFTQATINQTYDTKAVVVSGANARVLGVSTAGLDPGNEAIMLCQQEGEFPTLYVDTTSGLNCGDLITNDATGRATKITASATPAWYWCHGTVEAILTTGVNGKIIVRLHLNKQIYI